MLGLFAVLAIGLLFLLLLETDDSVTWVYFEPIQCGGNPYDGYANQFDKSDMIYFYDYYTDNYDVNVYDYNSIPSYMPVCEACYCKNGSVLSLLVDSSDVDIMLDLGFTTDPHSLQHYIEEK